MLKSFATFSIFLTGLFSFLESRRKGKHRNLFICLCVYRFLFYSKPTMNSKSM